MMSRDCRKTNSSARLEINGIMFESRPRKGYLGYWTTLNGRVSIRKIYNAGHRGPWRFYLDGKAVGSTDEPNFKDAIMANEWVVRRGL